MAAGPTGKRGQKWVFEMEILHILWTQYWFVSCREIASAIKKLLDAVNEVSAYIPGTSGKQALDQKKREFVKYSKRFSNTLKEFFRDGQ